MAGPDTPHAPEPTNNPQMPDYDWTPFFNAVKGQPPRETLVKALDLFEAEDAMRADRQWRYAVDLGCGEGRDLREILRRHRRTWWKAAAFDTADEPLVPDIEPHRWRFHRMPMERVPTEFPSFITYTDTGRKFEHADLINASFTLPFCDPNHFPTLWRWIITRLKPAGRFAGQFFGVDDEWNVPPSVQAAAAMPPAKIFHTRAQVEQLLSELHIEHLEEANRPGKTSSGETKHWHIFHAIARKP